MKNYALFSVNGRFIGFTNFKPLNGLYKEMPDTFDPVTQVYIGDYKTGSLKSIEELQPKDYREANIDKKWKVFETDLNADLKENIIEEKNYTYHKQLNTIMEALYDNRDVLNLKTEFIDMYNTIQNLRHNHKNAILTYAEAPKADVIPANKEWSYIDEYTKKQLSINESSFVPPNSLTPDSETPEQVDK